MLFICKSEGRRNQWNSEPTQGLDLTRFGGFCKYMHALPDSFRRISDGKTVRIGAYDWRVVGQDHSPEHACLLSDELGVLVSGDQVLPRISFNVMRVPHRA